MRPPYTTSPRQKSRNTAGFYVALTTFIRVTNDVAKLSHMRRNVNADTCRPAPSAKYCSHSTEQSKQARWHSVCPSKPAVLPIKCTFLERGSSSCGEKFPLKISRKETEDACPGVHSCYRTFFTRAQRGNLKQLLPVAASGGNFLSFLS